MQIIRCSPNPFTISCAILHRARHVRPITSASETGPENSDRGWALLHRGGDRRFARQNSQCSIECHAVVPGADAWLTTVRQSPSLISAKLRQGAPPLRPIGLALNLGVDRRGMILKHSKLISRWQRRLFTNVPGRKANCRWLCTDAPTMRPSPLTFPSNALSKTMNGLSPTGIIATTSSAPSLRAKSSSRS